MKLLLPYTNNKIYKSASLTFYNSNYGYLICEEYRYKEKKILLHPIGGKNEEYDKNISTLSPELIEQIDRYFNRRYLLKEHVIVGDGFYDDYIIKNKEKIKKNYDLYLTSNNKKVLKEALFNIILAEYALETQHYFHINNNGSKFRELLVTYKNLIDKVIKFTKTVKYNFMNTIYLYRVLQLYYLIL